MRTGYAISLCIGSALMRLLAVSATFTLKDNFVGSNFYSGFQWETFDDPTHGYVNYVDQGTGIANNLTFGKSWFLEMRYRCVSNSEM